MGLGLGLEGAVREVKGSGDKKVKIGLVVGDVTFIKVGQTATLRAVWVIVYTQPESP